MDINIINAQAERLSSYALRLKRAKNKLSDYKSSLCDCWRGTEVAYITRAIDRTTAQIDSTIKEIYALIDDLSNAASQVKREEDAAATAAAAQAAKAVKALMSRLSGREQAG